MKTLIVICIILFAQFCNGQNLSTEAGLKYGLWKDTLEYINSSGREIAIGKYCIISSKTYPIIRKSNSDVFYEVKYLNGSNLIFYSKIVYDSFSVSDGIRNKFDTLGNHISSVNWSQGIMLSSREYDSLGNLVYFDTLDYISNCFTAYRYIANRLFSIKESSINANNTACEYYSSDKLIVSNAEPEFTADFLGRPIDTNKIFLFAKDDITLFGIINPSGNFKFLDKKMKPLLFPFTISKNSTAVIYVLFKPSPGSLSSSEVLTLLTNEPDENEYPIYATTRGYHLNYQTVEKISKFSLSISKDKYLILPSMGTITTTSITYPSGEVKSYNIDVQTKIDLSGFKPGKYYINTIACNAGGSQTMILRK